MVSKFLEKHHVDAVNKQLPKVERDLSILNSHIRYVLTEKVIDGPDLSRILSESMRHAIGLHHDLEHLAESAACATRRSQGASYGVFKANYSGMLRRIQKEFDDLNELVPKLHELASEKLNAPGRHGNAYVGPENSAM
jgi:siderophore synthetase component